jgi:polar amino acid transport system substrate-binding protein
MPIPCEIVCDADPLSTGGSTMKAMRYSAPFFAGILFLAACTSVGSSASPSAAESAAESAAASATAATVCEGDVTGYTARVCDAGVLRVSTDPAYPPQSELLPDGTYEGFDIDVANEIGKRLGVTVEFVTPDFAEVVAGGWADRFDVSVGSVTITDERIDVLDFTKPYYYTPAQMGATTASGITTLDGLAGKTVCVGESTTYQFWLEGTLNLAGDVPDPAPVPEGAKVTTFSTDTECADAIASGRTDFEGWLTSSTTLANSIAEGAEFVEVGDPVFYEALAIAMDKSAEAHDDLMAALDQIVQEMHDDGTLTTFSEKWFEGLDLSVAQ